MSLALCALASCVLWAVTLPWPRRVLGLGALPRPWRFVARAGAVLLQAGVLAVAVRAGAVLGAMLWLMALGASSVATALLLALRY